VRKVLFRQGAGGGVGEEVVALHLGGICLRQVRGQCSAGTLAQTGQDPTPSAERPRAIAWLASQAVNKLTLGSSERCEQAIRDEATQIDRIAERTAPNEQIFGEKQRIPLKQCVIFLLRLRSRTYPTPE